MRQLKNLREYSYPLLEICSVFSRNAGSIFLEGNPTFSWNFDSFHFCVFCDPRISGFFQKKRFFWMKLIFVFVFDPSNAVARSNTCSTSSSDHKGPVTIYNYVCYERMVFDLSLFFLLQKEITFHEIYTKFHEFCRFQGFKKKIFLIFEQVELECCF